MKKSYGKIGILFLVFVMVFALASTSFAIDDNIPTAPNSETIEGISEETPAVIEEPADAALEEEAFAESEAYINDSSFNDMLLPYTMTTGRTEAAAQNFYAELKSGDTSKVKDSIFAEKAIFGDYKERDLVDTLLYIQDNYTTITLNMDSEQKDTFDKYYLSMILVYYDQYVEETLVYPEAGAVFDPTTNTDFEEAPELGVYVPELAKAVNKDLPATETPYVDGGMQPKAAGDVARVRIYSYSGSNPESSSGLGGHSWLTITNLTGNTIWVGKGTCGAGKTVAIGKEWSPANGGEHAGIYYSLEGYKQRKDANKYSGNVSMSVMITQNSLNWLNWYIANNDGYFAVNNNCTTLAAGAWNVLCSSQVNPGAVHNPTTLRNSIASYTAYCTYNYPVPQPYLVYHANGTGSTSLSNYYNK